MTCVPVGVNLVAVRVTYIAIGMTPVFEVMIMMLTDVAIGVSLVTVGEFVLLYK